MTKYRLRLKNARVIGPFIMSQLHELKSNGRIQGSEEAQIFPTGDWAPITSFDFYTELMDENHTAIITNESKEETFVIDLTKLRNQKNELEINKIDVIKHEPVGQLTETIRIPAKENKPAGANTKFEILLDNQKENKPSKNEVKKPAPIPESAAVEDAGDKTTINPIAQKDIERIRKNKKEEDARNKESENQQLVLREEQKKADELQKLIDADESTQMIHLDRSNSELMLLADNEEKKIDQEIKDIKKQKKRLDDAEIKEDEESLENSNF